jgi:hypothetical protein
VCWGGIEPGTDNPASQARVKDPTGQVTSNRELVDDRKG